VTRAGNGGAVIVQSGRPTAVINATVCGIIEEAARSNGGLAPLYGARGGLAGLLRENFFDLGREDPAVIEALRRTPAAALGTGRLKLYVEREFVRIIEVLRAHEVRYLFMIGGNDTMRAADRIIKTAAAVGYELFVIGVPKTIDNDLAGTHHCPGYGSAAKFAATAVAEVGLDSASFPAGENAAVIETMGRDTGWIAAATGVARRAPEDAPHLIYVPEIPVSISRILQDARAVYEDLGMVFVVAAEGCVDEEGRYIAEQGGLFAEDSAGRARLGGIAATLRLLLEQELGTKCRTLRLGAWQRSATSLASATDLEEALLCGQAAVRCAREGRSGFMVSLVRESDEPYRCTTGLSELSVVANGTRRLPREFMNERGNFTTALLWNYVVPLMRGSVRTATGPDGLPVHPRLRKIPVEPRAGSWEPE